VILKKYILLEIMIKSVCSELNKIMRTCPWWDEIRCCSCTQIYYFGQLLQRKI